MTNGRYYLFILQSGWLRLRNDKTTVRLVTSYKLSMMPLSDISTNEDADYVQFARYKSFALPTYLYS